jgi:hypothetical protein
MAEADRIRITKKNRAPGKPLFLTISSPIAANFSGNVSDLGL